MSKVPYQLSVALFAVLVACGDAKLECIYPRGYSVCSLNTVLVEVTQLSGGKRLEIDNLDLLAIREDAFKNVSTESLSFSQGNRISVLKRESFRGLPNLQRLDLDSNVISLSPHLFAELPELRSLSLMYNKVGEIPKDAFDGLSNLFSLYLQYNDIPAIERDSFAGLTANLTILWLNSNKISRIEPGAFLNLQGVLRLHLEDNRLEELPPGIWVGLKSLDHLSLTNNSLTSLRPNSFEGLDQLTVLHLEDNQIASLGPSAFSDLPKLKELYLSGNKLSLIQDGSFVGLPSLETLDLSNMLIDAIEDHAFRPLRSLTDLYLLGSNITEVNRNAVGLPASTKVHPA